MKRLIAAALAVAAMGVGAAHAQPNNLNTVIPNYNLSNVRSVMAESGLAVSDTQFNGQAAIAVQAPTGRTIVAVPTACENGSCAGLHLFAVIPGAASADMVNTFNLAQRPVRAMSLGDSIVIDRYLIGDFGTARGSLMVSAMVTLAMIDEWWAFRDQAGGRTAVAFEPLVASAPREQTAASPHLDDRFEGYSANSDVALGNGRRVGIVND